MGDIVDGMFEDGRLDWTPGWTRRSMFHSRPSSAPRAITCTRCGTRNLWWAPKHNRSYDWHLVTQAGDPHVCPVHDNEFEDLTKP